MFPKFILSGLALQNKRTMSSNLFRYRCPCCTLLLFTMVTVFACFVTGQPDKEKKRSNPVISFLRSQRLKSKALFGVSYYSVSPHILLFEPRCEKTGLRGFRPGATQTRLYKHTRWIGARFFFYL